MHHQEPTGAGGDVQMCGEVTIPLRDGVNLRALLYLPELHQEPSPAICTLTPYIAQTHHEQGTYFAARGYPFLAVDARGRGNSQGVFSPSINEAKDGYDIVEWLARQPYCNGKVAMWGGSYMGYAQWVTAKEFPPHLVTIVPVAAPFRSVDTPMRKNVFVPYTAQWLALVAGRASQEKMFADQRFWSRKFQQWFESGRPFRQLDRFVGYPSDAFQEWLEHPEPDAYWDRYNPSDEQYSRISLPILTITGVYDGDQLGALRHYREHLQHASPQARARHYLVIGPWDHAGTRVPKLEFVGVTVGPASLLDMLKLHAQWYAWTMQDGPKPPFLRKNVAYYVMGADTWRYADTLDEATARTEPLYLHSSGNPTDVFRSGLLCADMPGPSEPDHYIYDPRDVSLAELESTVDPESRADQRMVHARHGRQLVYHSAPFAQDTEITGFFKLTAWLSIDQPDTDFRATVYEAALDGSVIQLTSDWLRARYREGLRQEKLVSTREPLHYEFDGFTFVSRQVKRGNRLRLVIGPIDSIYSQKNYNSGGVVCDESAQDARPVLVWLYHDDIRPSALYVPYGQSERDDV